MRVFVLVAALCWLGVAWRLGQLGASGGAPAHGPSEDALLFRRALDAGLLRAEPDGTLRPVPRDHFLAAAWRGETVNEADARLLAELWNSPAGSAVRAELALWNAGRALAAVRDDAPPGVRTLGWRVFSCNGAPRTSGGLVPEIYGFLHQGRLRPGFGPWQVASGEECVEFRNRYSAPAPVAFEIWYVGQAEGREDARPLHPERLPKSPPCLKAPGALAAGKLAVAATGWRRVGDGFEREVRLRLTPARQPLLRVAGVKPGIDPKSCRFVWQEDQATPTAGKRGYRVSSVDGLLLLDGQGRPTEAARKLGLLPLVGFGRADAFSVGGLLARSALPRPGYELTLTLDSRLQKAAQTVLREGLQEMFGPDDPYAEARRAALVVLNADDGAILAAAGLPELPPGPLQDWDLAAFARVYPSLDPLRVRAWEAPLDRHDAPGSTFKPVTALAALAAAQQRSDIAEMLEGWDKKRFVKETGLALNAGAMDPYAGIRGGWPDKRRRLLHNFHGTSFLNLIRKRRLRAPECSKEKSPPAALGLPQALRESLNLWFAALELRVDGAAAKALDQYKTPDPPAWLDRAMRRLGFDRPLALTAGAPEFLSAWGRPTLPAVKATLWSDPRPARWVLAQNAIGQGVAASPLHMARLAASLATGGTVQPHLVASWDGEDVDLPEPEPWGLDLDLLRAGMKAVPEVGTAARAFRKQFRGRLNSPLRCNTWGKTGTAQVRGKNGRARYVSAWFIGWHRPAEGPPLAFACQVTHAHGRGHNSGGSVCAPLVARFLDRVYGGGTQSR